MAMRFKKDFIFLGILVLVGLLMLTIYMLLPRAKGVRVEISVDGEVRGTYELERDQTIEIAGADREDGAITNVLVIQGGKADMIQADCPDHICVKHKPVSKVGETIVCLPNKVVVTVVGEDSSELDAVAR